jgi:hypothetical protein
VLLILYYLGDKVVKDELVGIEEKYVQGFGWEN